ncbi:hypothetical protein F4778DRAFT_248529 [Xylariomycetidae sp. FL2044]|nr:hypothetical protein F4778DRAFT_248529 [Xylariomycetidae sp. FL2044]
MNSMICPCMLLWASDSRGQLSRLLYVLPFFFIIMLFVSNLPLDLSRYSNKGSRPFGLLLSLSNTIAQHHHDDDDGKIGRFLGWMGMLLMMMLLKQKRIVV